MKNNECVIGAIRSLCGIIVAAFTPSLCLAASETVEPNAAALVRAVRESENWLHRIDSLQFRVEGKWLRTPEGIAARRAELKRQDPDEVPDPNRDWSLRPSYGDSLEYTIDFVGQRLRIVENTPGRRYFLKTWDGRQTIRYARDGEGLEQYDLEPDKRMFRSIFGSLSWPRSQPHSFWWAPTNVEEQLDLFGRKEDFRIVGQADYRGVACYVLEVRTRGRVPRTERWYVGLKDRLLYGRLSWINPDFVFDHWTLDYKEVAPGCLMPTIQGYDMPGFDRNAQKRFVAGLREVRIANVRINERLSDELFRMEFKEGLYVYDSRSGKTVVYPYIATPSSLLGQPLPKPAGLGFDMPASETRNKLLLVCFWDLEQRPSRRCMARLAAQAGRLAQRDVLTMAVQASQVGEGVLDKWVRDNNVHFPIRMTPDDDKKIRLAWGVKSLPWLILTDRDHTVYAEGFAVEELDEKLRQLSTE